MDIALSYLKRLFDSGYFQQAHEDCAHLWLPDHPACVPAEPGPCSLCRRCIEVCEAGAIVFKEGKARILTSKCMGCARCVRVCPLTAKGTRSSLYTPLT